MTQTQLASLIGVTQTRYARWEMGHHQAPADMQIRIAALLGVSRDEAFPPPTTEEVTS
jgi:transcriptional regulator with XRE-family HTH domain